MSKRILVVEDQADTRQIIRDMLASTDYEITEAENGEQALAAIAKQRPESTPVTPQYAAFSTYKAARLYRGRECRSGMADCCAGAAA
jgi:two-component system, cell cycle response regulator DivK